MLSKGLERADRAYRVKIERPHEAVAVRQAMSNIANEELAQREPFGQGHDGIADDLFGTLSDPGTVSNWGHEAKAILVSCLSQRRQRTDERLGVK